jgi:hypothetical protein
MSKMYHLPIKGRAVCRFVYRGPQMQTPLRPLAQGCAKPYRSVTFIALSSSTSPDGPVSLALKSASAEAFSFNTA